MKSVSRENGEVVCRECEVADSILSRMVGLLGRESLAENQALWIVPCTSIHTFFMKFSIDAVFLDRSGKILKIYHSLAPWRHSGIHFMAHGVLELPAGWARVKGLQRGERLVLCDFLSR